jgi:hypothetical protein
MDAIFLHRGTLDFHILLRSLTIQAITLPQESIQTCNETEDGAKAVDRITISSVLPLAADTDTYGCTPYARAQSRQQIESHRRNLCMKPSQENEDHYRK